MLLSPTSLKVATNTMSQIIGKILSAISTIIISFVVAQKLGAAGYGDFAKITTYIAFFYLVADFGMNALFLHQKEHSPFKTLFVTRGLWSLALTFIAIAILAFLPQTEAQGFTSLVRLGIVLFAPSIIFQGIITTTNAVFQKSLRYDLATVALGIGSAATVLILIAILSSTPLLSPLVPTISILLGTMVTAIIALLLTKPFHTQENTPLSSLPLLHLFTASLPFGLTLLCNIVYTRADILVLTFTRATTDVGIYALAYKIFELVLVFPTFFMNAVYPLLLKEQTSELKAQNSKFKTIIKTSSVFLLLTSVICTLAIWLSAPLLVAIHPDFRASIPALRILSLALPFFFLTSVTMWSLIAQKKQGSLLAIYGLSMIINVAANIVFAPTYGYLASAWITVAAEGIVLLLSSLVLLPSLSST